MNKHLSTAKGEVSIRTAEPDDAAKLFELRLEALTAHPEAFAADVEMTRARGVEAWTYQLTQDARDQTGVIVVASAENRFVGMSGIGRGHWPKTQHGAIVWGVYVNADWRGMGIAPAMLEACIQWATEHSIVVLKLGVITSNDAAIHSYQRSGFMIYGMEPRSIYVDGNYYDEYLMAKFI